jgi:transposase
MLMEADLPSDVEALRALILAQARELDALKVFQAEVERLKAIIDALQRHRFGRRSEQLDPEQFELALEEVETALAEAQHAVNKASRASADRPRKACAKPDLRHRPRAPGSKAGRHGAASNPATWLHLRSATHGA